MTEQSNLHTEVLLIGNQEIADGIYSMTLAAADLVKAARPGQFVMVSVSKGIDPFLRRPFSIADIDQAAGTIGLLYQVVGDGTARMAAWEAGRQVDLLGPLGNGFTWHTDISRAILVGGGLGTAALLPLAKALRSQGKEVVAFVGARSAELIMGLRQLEAYGCRVYCATEDGSGGFHGFVTAPLEIYLALNYEPNQEMDQALGTDSSASTGAEADTMLFACGPTPFLQAVAGFCETYPISGQLSLEERMGCGFGACIGCSTPIRDGDAVIHKRACCDGPVFDAREVVFHG